MDHVQRKAYFLNEIEEITGPQANITAIVSLLTKLEPGLKQVLDEFLVNYQ